MSLIKATWAQRVSLSPDITALTQKPFTSPAIMAKTDGRISGEALLAHRDLGADLMFIPGGSGFKPHTHRGHHLIFSISGECTVTLGAEIYRLLPGEVCLIPGEVAHAVSGISDTMLIAVGTPHMPVDAEDRLELVPFDTLSANLENRIRCMGCTVHKIFERDEVVGQDGVVRCPEMRPDGQCRLPQSRAAGQ